MAKQLDHDYGQIDFDYAGRLYNADPDGPIYMVNLMRYKKVAEYADGRSDAISGQEADDRYAPVEVLEAIGASVAFFGDVAEQTSGDRPTWDRIGIVRYPTRRSFIEMQNRPDFQEKHVHKAAGMAETIVSGCLPVEAPAFEGEVTGGDAPVVRMEFERWEEGVDPGAVAGAERAVAEAEAALGLRPASWMDVEGTVIGDGRAWHRVRFTNVPDRAVLDGADGDGAVRAARAALDALAPDRYTMLVTPRIDALPRPGLLGTSRPA